MFSWFKAQAGNILLGIVLLFLGIILSWIINANTEIAILQNDVEKLEQLFNSASYVNQLADELVKRHADRLRGPKGDKGEKGEVGPQGPPGTLEQTERGSDSRKGGEESDSNWLNYSIEDVDFFLRKPCMGKGTVVACTIAVISEVDQKVTIRSRGSRAISSGEVFGVDQIEFGGKRVGFGLPISLIARTQMNGMVHFEKVQYAITEFNVIELKVYVEGAREKEVRFLNVPVTR